MKIRNGFVSNSSSSSFVLGKSYLSKEQIDYIDEKLDEINDNNYGEGYIESSKYYFIGTASQNNTFLDYVIEELDVGEYVTYGD